MPIFIHSYLSVLNLPFRVRDPSVLSASALEENGWSRSVANNKRVDRKKKDRDAAYRCDRKIFSFHSLISLCSPSTLKSKRSKCFECISAYPRHFGLQ
jgi:hypothetical protein